MKLQKEKFNIYAILFFLILLLGIFFRFYKLGELPGGLQRDEATVAMNSYNLFHNGTDIVGYKNPFYMTDWGDGHSNMYSWLTAFIMLFSKGVFSPFVSRFPQAFIAVITLLCVYGIGKNTLGVKFGLWSMFFLAVCPWHIMMARWGLDANLAPGFMMISLYFLTKSIEKERYLYVAGIFYALTLYTYAISWAVVPVTLIFEGLCLILFKKMKVNKTLIFSAVLMVVISIPVGLFLLVNNGYLPNIENSFLSIVRMNGYRGEEASNNLFGGLVDNLKQAYHLFVYQEGAGEIWEIRKPWGLFFDLGRILIVIGSIWLLVSVIKLLIKKTFGWEMLFLIQVLGGIVACVVTFPHLHRINLLYIPLIFCGAYGIYKIEGAIKEKNVKFGYAFRFAVILAFLVYSVFFWKDYTGEYRKLVEAYWGAGMDQCVETAVAECKKSDISKITVEKAAQWPKLVLYTETLAPTYMKNVTFEEYPIPWSFVTKEGIEVQTRIDYDDISTDSIYIIYFTDKEVFDRDFDLVSITDWYVAIPKK